MPISQSLQVYQLVKSLNQSEKRNFRLHAGRIRDSEEMLYIKLFDILEGQKKFNDEEVLNKMDGISATQYSNVKRHLYSQLLKSLRHLYREKKADIKIREYIDMATILYNKGLYMEALKILDKAKKISFRNHTDFNSLTIIEIEKTIQSRHITRTNTASIEALVEQANNISQSVYNRASLSNLKVLLHRYYIKKGHVTTAEEENELDDFFYSSLNRGIPPDEMGMVEKVNLYQCYVWYHYIRGDFENCYSYAIEWIKLLENSKEMMERDVDLYMRGFHYVLTSAFNTRNLEGYKIHLEKFENFRNSYYSSFNANSKIFSFLFVHTGRLNLHFFQGTFESGVKIIPRTLSRIKRYKDNLDEHKIMILYFKIAYMYLGNGNYKKSNHHLLNIINLTNKSLRTDIQIYARLMHLIVHYEMGSWDILPYLLKRYNAFLSSQTATNKMVSIGLELFKKLHSTPVLERKQVMKEYLDKFIELKKQKYTQKAFLYLDIIPWLQSKQSDKSIGQIIKEANKK